MPRLIALALALALTAPATAQPSAIQAEIARIAKPAEGIVGVAAWRLDGRGGRVLVNADQLFPMASTFKVAVAGAILGKVDRGELSLDQLVPVDPAWWLSPEGSPRRSVIPASASRSRICSS